LSELGICKRLRKKNLNYLRDLKELSKETGHEYGIIVRGGPGNDPHYNSLYVGTHEHLDFSSLANQLAKERENQEEYAPAIAFVHTHPEILSELSKGDLDVAKIMGIPICSLDMFNLLHCATVSKKGAKRQCRESVNELGGVP
jgi:proteasome lid subunit RPN8/RPN11